MIIGTSRMVRFFVMMSHFRHSCSVNIYIPCLAFALVAMSAFGQSNMVAKTTNQMAFLNNANDPVEKEYKIILTDDDAAQDDAERWIHEADSYRNKGIADPRTTLRNRLQQRFEPVGKAYKDFLQRHPDHVHARLAFGSFLNDTGDEDGALEQWEKARDLDPKNPAVWNNLGTLYGHHRSPASKAFECFEKAIELKPDEPVYYQNLASHVYLFWMDATNYYHVTETEVFGKALGLYQQAIKLDPDNFVLATEYAQSFYGTKPPRPKEGLRAWEQALKLARTELEREGVLIHFARLKIALGRLDEVRLHLDAITNESYATTKRTLTRNLTNAEAKTARTNAPVK